VTPPPGVGAVVILGTVGLVVVLKVGVAVPVASVGTSVLETGAAVTVALGCDVGAMVAVETVGSRVGTTVGFKDELGAVVGGCVGESVLVVGAELEDGAIDADGEFEATT
jgi:hypothetical protein